jgi:ABC-type Mn2+/Zn2+ transport system ATPase subunit
LYHVIIGESGTGKTTLIELALKRLKKPKGVIYFNVSDENPSRVDFVEMMLGAKRDRFIDSGGN